MQSCINNPAQCIGNSAVYGHLAASPPVTFTARVLSQCASQSVQYVNDGTAIQTTTVPSGCNIAVAIRIFDALDNVVVSHSAIASLSVTQDRARFAACAGGNTEIILDNGAANLTASVVGIYGATVNTQLSIRIDLTAGGSAYDFSSGTVRFVIGNCTAGTGRSQAATEDVVDACTAFSSLSCVTCPFGTYSLLPSNNPCNVLSSVEALSAGAVVCALPGYWVLVDPSSGLASVFDCVPGMCNGSCSTQIGVLGSKSATLQCYQGTGADGQVNNYCSGGVSCSYGRAGLCAVLVRRGLVSGRWMYWCVLFLETVLQCCFSPTPADCTREQRGLLAVWFFVLWAQVAVVNVGLSGQHRAQRRRCCTLCKHRCFCWDRSVVSAISCRLYPVAAGECFRLAVSFPARSFRCFRHPGNV